MAKVPGDSLPPKGARQNIGGRDIFVIKDRIKVSVYKWVIFYRKNKKDENYH